MTGYFSRIRQKSPMMITTKFFDSKANTFEKIRLRPNSNELLNLSNNRNRLLNPMAYQNQDPREKSKSWQG